jgi:hypothetical protein
MSDSTLIHAALIGVVAFAVNLPLGYLREGTKKFSFSWFIYIHLSVPLIAFLRISNQVSAWAIPAFVACAILGQLAGGMIRRSVKTDPGKAGS